MQTELIETSPSTESEQIAPRENVGSPQALPERMRSRAKDWFTAKNLFAKRLMRWMCPERRIATRYPAPPVIAYLGTVRSFQEYKIGDISVTGFYMITEDRWAPGTIVPITFERTDQEDAPQSLTVDATVVRSGPDGVGFSFFQEAAGSKADGRIEYVSRENLAKVAQFLKGLPLAAPPVRTS